MLEHSVPFCPAHLHNHCQPLCFEQINDDDAELQERRCIRRVRFPKYDKVMIFPQKNQLAPKASYTTPL